MGLELAQQLGIVMIPRAKGKPKIVTDSFAVETPPVEACLMLVENGEAASESCERVSSATIALSAAIDGERREILARSPGKDNWDEFVAPVIRKLAGRRRRSQRTARRPGSTGRWAPPTRCPVSSAVSTGCSPQESPLATSSCT